MQNVTVLCVGRLKEKFYLDACAEYQKRLTRCCKLSLVELSEERLGENPSAAQIEAALEREAAAIEEKLPRGGLVVALCVEGEALSSEELSETLAREALRGAGPVTFVIGGSFGLAGRVKRAAGMRLSMSAMTFPHHLARVMLLEQLYRAYQIQNGTKYHK